MFDLGHPLLRLVQPSFSDVMIDVQLDEVLKSSGKVTHSSSANSVRTAGGSASAIPIKRQPFLDVTRSPRLDPGYIPDADTQLLTGRTTDRGQIAKLVGIAPIVRESGQSAGNRRIHGGHRLVRRAISMATIVATRWNDRIKQFSQHLLAKAKPKKLAIVACMRKMFVILNTMIKTKQKCGENQLAS